MREARVVQREKNGTSAGRWGSRKKKKNATSSSLGGGQGRSCTTSSGRWGSGFTVSHAWSQNIVPLSIPILGYIILQELFNKGAATDRPPIHLSLGIYHHHLGIHRWAPNVIDRVNVPFPVENHPINYYCNRQNQITMPTDNGVFCTENMNWIGVFWWRQGRMMYRSRIIEERTPVCSLGYLME